MENINFTPKDILERQFKQKMRGYDPNDVDSFLDDIIKDYERFTKTITDLTDQNQRLKVQVDELNKQITVASQSTPSATATTQVRQQPSQPMSSATNMDILKRLSNLERRVFGSQLDNGASGSNESHRL
ncbi:cell division regulator GpsB [Lentilactobacillus sp. Marseille-Q4993]|uniref:cell division regulator GpsB n=1 Tax=Lentilactobacillus sp. Marseille-Q4993 TaxID=3039492 RepID=UPI0024BD4C6B|nr:cell division regulator GpsB [Lentilactobacillus sp. Marseille-Q4993]